MTTVKIKNSGLKLALLFSLACACFAYGFAARAFQLFPYHTIRDAHSAAQALVHVARHGADTLPEIPKGEFVVPTVRNHARVDSPELILLSGGRDFLSDRHAGGCVAWLIDRGGTVRHFWKYDSTMLDSLRAVTQLPLVSGNCFPVGIHLYDDGDLLVNYQGENVFPFAVGMARYDKNSNTRWKKELLSHHWFHVADDGRIYVPALRLIRSPLRIANTEYTVFSGTEKMYGDTILILDPDGNVLDEIPMLDALFASGFGGLLARGGHLHSDDPLHLNFVQRVGAEVATWQPWLAADDLLVSFRHLNAIGILDPTSRRFKWMSTGTTVHQHSPRFLDQGVLVLDNQGGNLLQGGTQIVKIDLSRQIPTTIFPRPGVSLPHTCRTENSGHLDIHRDGNRVLFTMTRAGRVWEIDLRTGQVLWEYIYVHPNGDGTPQPINTAKYVYRADFISYGSKS